VVAQAAAPPRPNPEQLLDELLRDGGGISVEAAEGYLAQARDARREWRAR
jgi:hypothetical protein